MQGHEMYSLPSMVVSQSFALSHPMPVSRVFVLLSRITSHINPIGFREALTPESLEPQSPHLGTVPRFLM